MQCGSTSSCLSTHLFRFFLYFVPHLCTAASHQGQSIYFGFTFGELSWHSYLYTGLCVLIAPWGGIHSIELVDFGLTRVKYYPSSLLGFMDFGLFNKCVSYRLYWNSWIIQCYVLPTCSFGIPFLSKTAAVSFSRMPLQVCRKVLSSSPAPTSPSPSSISTEIILSCAVTDGL